MKLFTIKDISGTFLRDGMSCIYEHIVSGEEGHTEDVSCDPSVANTILAPGTLPPSFFFEKPKFAVQNVTRFAGTPTYDPSLATELTIIVDTGEEERGETKLELQTIYKDKRKNILTNKQTERERERGGRNLSSMTRINNIAHANNELTTERSSPDVTPTSTAIGAANANDVFVENALNAINDTDAEFLVVGTRKYSGSGSNDCISSSSATAVATRAIAHDIASAAAQ